LKRSNLLDPVEIRRRNFVPPDAHPYKAATGLVHDSGNHEHALDRALEAADYSKLRRQQAEARKRGEIVGIGLATYVDPSGGLGWESGLVRVEQAGKVTAVTGSSPHGQGLVTAFAQVVADYLGAALEDVTVRHGDTLGVPPGVGTFGSRSAAFGGSAMAKAAIEVREKGRRLAAALLEASAEDIQPVRGGFHVKGVPDRAVSWTQVAEFAYRGVRLPPGESVGLEATVFYFQEQEMLSFGSCIAVVRINRETGKVQIERLITVDDCGNTINPLLVDGQVEGGLVQGIGQALLEQVIYGEDGQLLTGTFMEYALPRADDAPPIILENTVTPSPLNPLGVKGVGESGTVAAPAAILNAVVDALAPFGIRQIDVPLTPEKIWRALNRASQGAT
jgi:carbon-monoxide dehydrogenase large subunit